MRVNPYLYCINLTDFKNRILIRGIGIQVESDFPNQPGKFDRPRSSAEGVYTIRCDTGDEGASSRSVNAVDTFAHDLLYFHHRLIYFVVWRTV